MGNGVSGPQENNCALEGEWVPVRKNEWKNRNVGSHKMRAAMAHTKMTYDSHGNGKGWVGDVYVNVRAWTLARGQFNSVAKIPALLWSANDGNLTILSDGTLEVRYPSNGILEYWKRKEGGGRALLQRALSFDKPDAGPSREIMLLFRKVDSMGVTWHWALGVGRRNPSIYEVAGSMAVVGPKGVVYGIPIASKAAKVGTKMSQFKGYVLLRNRSTTKTDAEIENFCKTWCVRHPVYNPLGPNCQTFAEDLHIYLTGGNLEFSKVGDLKRGPEASSDVRTDTAMGDAVGECLRCIAQDEHFPEMFRQQAGVLRGVAARANTAQLRKFVGDAMILASSYNDETLRAMDALLQPEARSRSIWSIDSERRHHESTESIHELHGANLYVLRKDITLLEVDCIVNAANENGLGCFQPHHKCIDNIIHRFAGPRLRVACTDAMARRKTQLIAGSEPLVTNGFHLPCKYVFHSTGPQLQRGCSKPSKGDQDKLERVYLTCLQKAESMGLNSIAFCCISTGLFGYPQADAANLAFRTVLTWLSETSAERRALRHIIFNVFTPTDETLYARLFEQQKQADVAKNNDDSAPSRPIGESEEDIMQSRIDKLEKAIEKATASGNRAHVVMAKRELKRLLIEQHKKCAEELPQADRLHGPDYADVLGNGLLFLGSQRPVSTEMQRRLLREKLGVSVVINCTKEVTGSEGDAAFTDFRRIAIADRETEHIDFRDIVGYMGSKIAQGHRLYVHCQRGVSRSVAVVAAFLVSEQGCSVDEALALIQDIRPISKTRFRRHLDCFAKELQDTTS
eukprot:g5463.t1